jgi:glycosyltransferase involved in cell wall biosynthesis
MSFLMEHPDGIAVRMVNIGQPLPDLADVSSYSGVRVFVEQDDALLGYVDIANAYQPVARTTLQAAIDRQLEWHLVNGAVQVKRARTSLPPEVSVSIVVATYDRPDNLRHCLGSLLAQRTDRPVEIVVVDNHPASKLTSPVVAEFSGVALVSEPRQGLAYARNAGFLACHGDIVVTTDDDVIAPPGWLEKLIAPFAHSDVMIVTGNILPLELETKPQCLFEQYGGLGRGFEGKEVNLAWFNSFRYQAVPTWRLGATANAAFRTTIFSHPEIGLMDEALGPGMPSGVGEDTYLYYKVLRAGYTLVYEPSAYVWHRHRRDMLALQRQIYDYSKGHVAYHLTTVLRDRDWRALFHIAVLMPPWRLYQAARLAVVHLLGRSNYSLPILWWEIKGNLLGPWALWQSRKRVRCEGRSGPYVPVSQRSTRREFPRPAQQVSARG